MKPNKTYALILLWLLHFYIFYGLTIVYYQYETDGLRATFWDFKSSLEFILMIPMFSIIIVIYYTTFLAIILMVYLIEHKKYKIFKSYLISITFFYVTYLLHLSYRSHIYDWLITLISLIVTGIIIKMIFRKIFKRLDTGYNLR